MLQWSTVHVSIERAFSFQSENIFWGSSKLEIAFHADLTSRRMEFYNWR